MDERAPVNDALRRYLETRRSVPALRLNGPVPEREEIEAMLSIASRVPDHGKLAPWRFIVYRGEVRARLGGELAEIAGRRAELDEEQKRIELERLTRAPLVVAVVSRTDPLHPKIPEWEQILSAGAVCYGLCMAANALGFGANWLTEWLAFDPEALATLGVAEGERVAGFIHIGTPDFAPPDRPRPELSDIITWAE